MSRYPPSGLKSFGPYFGQLFWPLPLKYPFLYSNIHFSIQFSVNSSLFVKGTNCNSSFRYAIMQKCWQEIPNDRLSFPELRQTFEDMLQQENPYFELSNIDETKHYYQVPCDGVQE